MAGFNVNRIITEPTAICIAYGLEKIEKNQKIAIYNFGGTSFDISILSIDNG